MISLLIFTLATPPQFTVVNKCPVAYAVVNKTPTPAVVKAKAATFRSGDWHDGHDCPGCGGQQLRVAAGSVFGIHVHACAKCGTTWRHGG